MEYILYYQKGTRSQRVRWMLEELGLSYKLEFINLFKGEGFSREHIQRHPLGQLPVLMIDGHPMFESGAIVQWLADYYPDKKLSPALNTDLRRDFEQWMYFSVTSLEMPAWEIILHSKILRKKDAVKEIIPFASNSLLQVFAVLEKELTDKPYLLGQQFSAVDIMTAYILMWFPDYLTDFPQLQDYVERLKQRPAYILSNEERPDQISV